MERWFWISMKHATFGIMSRDGIVVIAPPIAYWMVCQSLTAVKPWLLSKRAKVIELTGL